MKLWACGRDTVTYSASMAKEVMTNKTFVKSRNELVEKGFIDYLNKFSARDKREIAEYELSNRWYTRTYTLPKRIDSG